MVSTALPSYPSTPDRTAITNATQTQVRRIDFVYTQQNGHSMGSGFLTKRFVTDANGTPRAAIDANLQWIVRPEGTNGTAMCKGTFTTTKAYP
jgi:hypothetical protein